MLYTTYGKGSYALIALFSFQWLDTVKATPFIFNPIFINNPLPFQFPLQAPVSSILRPLSQTQYRS